MLTDNLAFLLSIIFLIHGAARGFMLSLIFPLAIILATIISVIYYQLTKEVIVTLLIGLIGPFILNFLFKLLLKSFAASVNRDIKPSFLSRVGGAFLTLAWGWVFIVFTLILLAVLPPWGKTLTAIHKDVTQSMSYAAAKPWGESLFNISKQNSEPAANNTTSLASNNDAKALAEDPRFQRVLQDPEIQKEIDNHDIVKLMSNPKMVDLTRQIMSDPATMKKIMALYSHQTQAQSAESSDSFSGN